MALRKYFNKVYGIYYQYLIYSYTQCYQALNYFCKSIQFQFIAIFFSRLSRRRDVHYLCYNITTRKGAGIVSLFTMVSAGALTLRYMNICSAS